VIRSAVRAYPTLLRVGISGVIAYRAEFLIWILTTNMPLVMLAIWHEVAADGAVGRFDQKQFTAYYLAILAVRLLTSTWVVWQMSMEIRDGTLSAKLLRPLHPLIAYSAEHLAAVPLRFLVISPIAVILVLTAGDRLAVRDPALLAIFLGSLVGAWLLIFFTMVLMGALSFFIESALGLFELWLAIHAILSGYLIPLEALPFRFMLGFPVETLVGLETRSAALTDLGIQWAYVAIFCAAAIAVWRAGVRRFAAYGG
jgi:ABC-2 type transport system permease protein